MHIPDGLLEPEVCLATGLASTAAIAYSLRQVNRQQDEALIPLTGVTAAMIFAAQMVNFPLFLVPVSGHLMGGVLAALILGPWAGCLAMTMVVTVQCLLFADGGVLSLGANILHMAVLSSWGGYFICSQVQRLFSSRWLGLAVGTGLASWLTVLMAAFLFSFELKWSLPATDLSFGNFLMLMLLLHMLIGLGEAGITILVLNRIWNHHPQILHRFSIDTETPPSSFRHVLVTGLVCSLMVALFLAPWASSSPDGLEAALSQESLDHLESPAQSLFLSDYEIPWLSEYSTAVSVGIAGIIGTVAVFILSLLFGRLMQLKTTLAGAGRE